MGKIFTHPTKVILTKYNSIFEEADPESAATPLGHLVPNYKTSEIFKNVLNIHVPQGVGSDFSTNLYRFF